MLIEMWERLRGYNKWIQTEATIKSSELLGVELIRDAKDHNNPISWNSECRFIWLDQESKEHSGSFVADEESPLYQLCDGDKFQIHFNPKDPSSFYIPGLLQSDITRLWKFLLWSFIVILILALYFSPEILRVIGILKAR
jgi:hypothetical protein